MPEKILIADDEHYVLESTMRHLRGRGYDVVGAESGAEALKRIAGEPFDLLLLDIKMPGISGLELLREARRINPEIMAIIVTGYGSVENAIEAMELGALGFVRKPVPIEELSAAIEEALTRGRLRRENTRLKALLPLFELSKVILSEVDEDRLLDLILKTATSEIYGDFAQILLWNDNGKLVRRAACGLSPPGDVGKVVQDDLAVEAITRLEPIVVPDVGKNPVATSDVSQIDPSDCHIYVPLAVGGEALGALSIVRVEGGLSYQESDIEFLCTLCGQGAIAIANVRLVESLQRKQVEVEGLYRRAIDAAENERLRLSLDLHDGPIQSIIASQLDLKTCSLYVNRNKLDEAEVKLESVLKMLGDSVRDLRRIVRDLNPPPVSKQGLIVGIREYLANVERNDGIRCHLDVTGPETWPVTSMERDIFYVVREALVNVRKHSGASEVRVLIESGADNFAISIADNGRGFNPTVLSSQSSDGHLGIQSMKERAKILHGNVSIRSKQGMGTVVMLSVPLVRVKDSAAMLRVTAYKPESYGD